MKHDVVLDQLPAVTRTSQVMHPLEGVVYPTSERLARYVAEGALTRETLASAYVAAFERHADRIAICGSAGSLSYGQLDDRSDRLAAALLRLGALAQDRALFQLGNSPDLVVCVMACLKIGVIPICTLVNHREHEIGSLGRYAQARFWFVEGAMPNFDLCNFARELKPAIPTVAHVIVARGTPLMGQHALEELIGAQTQPAAREISRACTRALDPFQVAVFQLSGGTTGLSKIVPRFSNEYLYNMRAMIEVSGREEGETIFCGGPFLHNAPFVLHWGPSLLIGGKVVIGTDLSDKGLHALLKDYRPTWAYLPKPLVVRLASAQRDAGPIPSIATIATSAPASLVLAEFAARAVNPFGMAEGIVMLQRLVDGAAAPDGACGSPISPLDEVRLVDPHSLLEVDEGEVGELIARGPYTLHGYYRADDKNRASFTEDGYLRTGDLMRRVATENGPLYVYEGRCKDVIKRAGESIIPDEVERAVGQHPAVSAVAVVAVPDAEYGERACACLILRPGARAPSVPELGAHLRGLGFAKFKWPEFICIRDDFPVTSSGKVSKPLLRNEVIAVLAARP